MFQLGLDTNFGDCHYTGILGLCAIVLSSPYDIPIYVPDALMLLCEHSHDPDLMQVRIFHLQLLDCMEFFSCV
jgi:hypothetical protein